ncbi:MAG TPA: AsmA family protein [Caulobacteraceae bacterium]|nr:AsmA family protein [Caulobacteraceae bacterium]
MQKPVRPLHADHTPALAWARANLRWTGLPSPAEDFRRLRAAPAKIPPKARLPAAFASALLLAIIIFAMIFQWNWLRGPIAEYASARMNRHVAIDGDLEVHPWSLSPRATANGVTVSQPAWTGKTDNMVELPRLTVQVQLMPLLKRQVILPLVDVQKPKFHLIRDAGGRANWNFHDEQPARPLKLPPIHHFIIEDGALRIDDARRKLTFVGVISSNEQTTGAGRGVFTLDGRGLLNGTNFLAKVTGGPLLHVDPNIPYQFDARVQSGATKITAVGAIPHPFDLGAFSAKVHASGADLADLYELTGLAFPTTPPYDLAAGFGRVGAHYSLRRIHGRVGVSDLSGAMKVDASEKKPFLSADLASRRLDFADFLAVFGGVPKHTAGRPLSPTQRAQAAKLRAEHRVLPDQPLKTDRLKAMDARVDYRAETVQAGKLPVRKLVAKVKLQDSVLTFDPLSLILPQGALAGQIRIDGRRAVPAGSIDMRLSNARLETFIPSRGGPPPVEGAVLARAKLAGTGQSVRAVASNADGSVSVLIPHGQIRQAFAELLGINALKGGLLLWSKNQHQTPIRCAVVDFRAQNGVLNAERIVIDTGVVRSEGHGQINLKDETVNLRFTGKSKKFRLVRVMAPITVKGRLAEPNVGVDLAKATPQLGIAGVLGALVSPLAAIIPFIDPGGAKDADCAALMTEPRAPAQRVASR